MASTNLRSITEASISLRDHSVTAVELMQSCLDRIAHREPVVKAWVMIDGEAALNAAEQADRLMSRSVIEPGPLHGIPVGIKDIIDVEGMPTACGTDAYPERIASSDAACVARLKAAGAIVLGKTVTTAFAMGDAGATTNPWNPAHTPGGSSSGSAAAVADRMCFAALGTQTAGSVIRPCSFNGLAGIKPTYGQIEISGVFPLSVQLDHVGALTRSLSDSQLLWNILRDTGGWRAEAADQLSCRASKPKRLWRARELFETHASAAISKSLDTHCERLQEQGVEIIERSLPVSFDGILNHHRIIMASEAAASHADNFSQRASMYPQRIKQLIEEGQKITASQYKRALQHRHNAIEDMNHALGDVTGLLSPATVGSAPPGLHQTGERTLNAPSSYLGLPVVTYPIGTDDNRLPLGAQIMSASHSEDNLLEAGMWCEELVGFDLQPG